MRLIDIFFGAIERSDPAERAAFLDQACGPATFLRDKVEALLRSDDASEFVLEPPCDGAPTTSPTPVPDTQATVDGRLGRYELREELGHGGMGRVYRAEQVEPVRRPVAVKVVKAGMDSPAVLARFEAEQQALGRMDHPNIPRVLDVGTFAPPHGRDRLPFIVMELVAGVPVTDFCDAHSLSIRERLELFVPVCQAIQHAHLKGIIHRDIKPSNVLVTAAEGGPVPKVIDFGIAKATGEPLLAKPFTTGFAVIGTPEYMSPEQAGFDDRDIDTRSDVYSLGVLLYELLTGSTPVDARQRGGVSANELLRLVREFEAPRPSARVLAADTLPAITARRGVDPRRLSSLLRNELDWVVMKALEKEPARRYETAEAMARDIQRYLTNDVVEARPTSRGYRVRKFVRRNRPHVIAAALVGVSLVAGMVGTTIGLLQAQQQSELARAEANERELARRAEQRARESAEANELKAVAAAEKEREARAAEERQRRFAEAIGEFATYDLLALTTTEGQFRFAGGPNDGLRKDVTLRALLDRAAVKLRERRDLEPRTEAELCWIVGVSYRASGAAGLGIEFLERAVRIRTERLGRDHGDTLLAMNSLAQAYGAAGRKEALALQEETVRRATAALGANDRTTLVALNNLAQFYRFGDRLADGIRVQEETHQRLVAELGEDHPDALKCLGNLAEMYQMAGNLGKALPAAEQAHRRAVAALGADHPDTLLNQYTRAKVTRRAGRRADARTLLEDGVPRMKTVLGNSDQNTVNALAELAFWYQEDGDRAKALPLFDEAYKLREAALGPDHPNTLQSLNNLAYCHRRLGAFTRAIPLYEQVAPRMARVLGATHADTLDCLLNFGECRLAAGHLSEAVALLEDTLRRLTVKDGAESPKALICRYYLAIGYRRTNRIDDSVRSFRDNLAHEEKRQGRKHPDTLLTLAELGVTFLEGGRYGAAIELFREVRTAANGLAEFAWVGKRLLEALASAGRLADADRLAAELVAAARERFPKGGSQLATELAAIGGTLLGTKQFAGAEALFREGLAFYAGTKSDGWGRFYLMTRLGHALLGQGKLDEADRLLVSGYEGLKQRRANIPPARANCLPEAADRLLLLAIRTQKPAAVEKWRAERATYPPELAPHPRRFNPAAAPR